MTIEIKVPSPGESISEVEISAWFVKSGDKVKKDQEVGEIESEKATLPLLASEDGEITLLKEEGETVPVGEVVGTIEPSKKGNAEEIANASDNEQSKDSNASGSAETEANTDQKKPQAKKSSQKEEQGTKEPHNSLSNGELLQRNESSGFTSSDNQSGSRDNRTTPVAKKMMEEHDLSIDDVINGLRKIGKKEMEIVLGTSSISSSKNRAESREEEKKPISKLRKKLSERLVSVKNETAMLTTFNEADMSAVISLRKNYQSAFMEKHGIKLGYMSFFTKAVSLALEDFPNINSRIEENQIIHAKYTDIGIAVQTDKGLMVPVLRNVENMSLADIEKEIAELARQARKNRISIDQMSGGTFTITNGGIYGSLLSTPILNPPQSAILGMHNIVDRPIAIAGKVEIRPMMYLALSYDHRLVDGRDSVSFLVLVKEYLENPERMLTGKIDLKKRLLDLD